MEDKLTRDRKPYYNMPKDTACNVVSRPGPSQDDAEDQSNPLVASSLVRPKRIILSCWC